MTFLFDANAVIAVMKRNHRFGERMRRHRIEQMGMSSVVLFELYYGMFRSERVEENLRALRAISLPVVEFDAADAEAAGEVRARLGAEGRMIGPYDTMIAGQALARDLVLVTRNTREFSRIAGLKIEDWEG